jgi:transglutaminase-like putative cysteine protease
MRRLRIEHLTVYEFPEPVTLLPHRLLLRPREDRNIQIDAVELTISPAHQLHWQRDSYCNALAVAHFSELSSRLSIASRILLRHYDDQPLDFWVADHAAYYPFQYDLAERSELGPTLLPNFPQDTAPLANWLRRFWQPGQNVETYALLERINMTMAKEFSYVRREQPGVQTPAKTLAEKGGSCRDTATLFIDACRHLGIAARFVSGYLYSPFDAAWPGATHAWAEVYLPGVGWKGFDTTSGLLVGNQHIAVAISPHPESIPPVAGSFLASRVLLPTMHVAVSVVEFPG